MSTRNRVRAGIAPPLLPLINHVQNVGSAERARVRAVAAAARAARAAKRAAATGTTSPSNVAPKLPPQPPVDGPIVAPDLPTQPPTADPIVTPDQPTQPATADPIFAPDPPTHPPVADPSVPEAPSSPNKLQAVQAPEPSQPAPSTTANRAPQPADATAVESGTAGGKPATTNATTSRKTSTTRKDSTTGGKSIPSTRNTEKPATVKSAPNHCRDLTELLEKWVLQAKKEKVKTPAGAPKSGEGLLDEMIWRAIASVTEAISSNTAAGTESVSFSQVDPDNLGHMRLMRDFAAPAPAQLVARPGNEAFLVRTDGTNGGSHNSLYYLRRIGGDRFEIASYDCAVKDWHRGARGNNQATGTQFQRHLATLGWNRSNLALEIAPALTESDPPARQRANWDCGFYVIIYAWALALGLDISGFSSFLPRSRQGAFVMQSIAIVKLSLQGYCDSATILAFLKCFGIVPLDATIPAARQFERTVPFLASNDLRRRIAQLRLDHDLSALGLPSIDVVLGIISEKEPRWTSDLWTRSADEVSMKYMEIVSADDPPGSSGSGPAGGDTGAPGGTGPSGGDTAASGGTGPSGGDTAAPGGTRPSDGKKRPRQDGDGLNGPPSKKPKYSEPKDGQTTKTTAATKDPCAALAKELSEMKDIFNSVGDADMILTSGVQSRQQLPDETVYRAIAAVTEAVSELPGQTAFSLMSLTSIRLPAGSPLRQRIARPGNPALIPHTQDGHTSLFSLQLQLDGQYALHHYDSAGVGHEGALQRYGDQIRNELAQLGWYHRDRASVIQATTIPRANPIRQSHGWECGMHTVFYAWAIALGLRITGTGTPQPADRFLRDAAQLINYALLGIADSDVILAFLQCYGFVSRDQVMLADRRFRNTMDFVDLTALEYRIAYLRVEEDLTELRKTDPLVPRLDYLRSVTGLTRNDILITTGALAYADYRLMRPQTPPAQNGGNVSGSTTEVSPETLLAIQRLEEQQAVVPVVGSLNVIEDADVEDADVKDEDVEDADVKDADVNDEDVEDADVKAADVTKTEPEPTAAPEDFFPQSGPPVFPPNLLWLPHVNLPTTLLHAVNTAPSSSACSFTSEARDETTPTPDVEAPQQRIASPAPTLSLSNIITIGNTENTADNDTDADTDTADAELPLSEADDLFGDDSAEGAALQQQEQQQQQQQEAQTIAAQRSISSSSSLVLPPPTPRNTAPAAFGSFPPGEGRRGGERDGDEDEDMGGSGSRSGTDLAEVSRRHGMNSVDDEEEDALFMEEDAEMDEDEAS